MSKCETCANFVYQAIVDKKISDGRIFKGTPLEQDVNKNAFSYPQCGCIHSGWKWRRAGRLRKPSNMACEYKEKANDPNT